MAFTDEKPNMNPGCPLKTNKDYNCRKMAVQKALFGVSLSPRAYYVDLPSVMHEVCEFCKKEHGYGR